uniref:IS5 family transposase n=1 Tax=Gluconobacter sphaericus TaxID=574987 RepID=UPI001EEE7C5F|nr:IS5 family transposase [Gluconobacter sphaericus]
MARGDLTDREWAIIGPLLPPERGRWARPAKDNRRFLNGMLHVLRTGYPWRDMHERYGKWNSVYVRFRRWAEQGVWDVLLQTLVNLGLTDNWQHMVDSTVVRAPEPCWPTGAMTVTVSARICCCAVSSAGHSIT